LTSIILLDSVELGKVKTKQQTPSVSSRKGENTEGLVFVNIFMAFPYGSGYSLQCPLALRDSVGIFAAIPNAKAK
jgi:hypothetical protein